ncbi:MAG TPA: alpha-(1-_3)-arabinofuranosyltransferase family protein, partial [Candidatus Eremiobacteraceae bacterium]|nr:alpha-(1->3)-arabinofuranosyltransferase family protein [Candidatus Eremiobacteraceae bacterium]
MRTKSLAYILPSIAFLLLVCLHWAQPPTVIAQIDLPPAYDPGNALAKCAFVWSDYRSYFGSVDACFSWLPYRLVEWAMYAAFGASYGQALVFGAAVIISWLGGFACARALGVSEAGSFVTAWLYAFNPARQSMFGLFATGEVCAALLPWVLYWIVVAAHEPQRRAKATFAIAGLSFAALVVLAVTPQLLAAVLLAAVIAAAYFLARSPDRAAFASWAGATFAFVVAAGSWWLVPDAISYLGAPIAHAVAASSVAWTFARASLLNELRFCATWFWQYPEYNPWAVEFERNPWFYVSGFAPVACAVAALIVCTGERLRFARFFCGVALVMLFIAKGVHAPLAQVNTALYALPGMFLFIEPDGPILIAALAFAVCAGFAADSLLRSPRAFARAGGAAFSGVAVTLVLWNNAAAITGAIFHEETQATPGVHIALPDYWRKAAAFLNSTPQPGGVVILPVDDFYQADYDWGYHGVDTLPGELIHRPVLMPGAPWGYTVLPEAERLDGEIGHLVARHAPQTAVFLSRLGIRYALVRYDVRPVNHGFVPAHDDYATLFAGRPALVFGKLEIFDLGEASAELRGTMATSAETATAQVTEARQIAYAALPKSRLTSGDAVPSVIGQAPIDST